MSNFLFPRWTNRLPLVAAVASGCLAIGLVSAFWYWGTDKYWRVGYSPEQPIPFSHKLHAGNLGMDCRYCHNTVERSPYAAVPSSQTCMNCHSKIKTDSPKLAPLRDSYAQDLPIVWKQVHHLAEFAYFNHAAHLASGVGCSSCHGRVDQMTRVQQVKPLTMGWCLECHRNPAPNIRAHSELTKMDWEPNPNATEAKTPTGRIANPPVHCSGCHR